MTLRGSTLAILLIALTTLPLQAQTSDQAAASPSRLDINWGVRFGPSFTSLSSVEPFDSTVVAAAREPTLNFGGFLTVDLPGPLALQPEILFAAKGHRVRDKD